MQTKPCGRRKVTKHGIVDYEIFSTMSLSAASVDTAWMSSSQRREIIDARIRCQPERTHTASRMTTHRCPAALTGRVLTSRFIDWPCQVTPPIRHVSAAEEVYGLQTESACGLGSAAMWKSPDSLASSLSLTKNDCGIQTLPFSSQTLCAAFELSVNSVTLINCHSSQDIGLISRL